MPLSITKKLALHLLFLLYIYTIKYVFLPIDSSKLVWIIMVSMSFFVYLFNAKYRFFCNSLFYSFKSTFVLFLFSILLIFLSLFNDSSSLTIPYYAAIYAIDFVPVAVFFCYLCYTSKISPLKLIIFVGLIQSISIFLMIILPQVKDIYGSLVSVSSSILEYYSYRFVGLTGFANYTVGTTQIMILCIGINECIKNSRITKLECFYFSLIFLSALFSSRSSMVVLAVFILIQFFILLNKKYLYTRLFPVFIVAAIVTAFGVYSIVSNQALLDNSFILRWALEPIINYVNSGDFSTNSSDTLSSFYFYPGDNTFYFGDWKYVNNDGSYYHHVDAGYMRVMLFMGIIFSSVYYIIWINMNFSIMNNLRCRNTKAFVIFFIITMFVLHYKGNAFVDASSMIRLYIFYVCYSLTRDIYER